MPFGRAPIEESRPLPSVFSGGRLQCCELYQRNRGGCQGRFPVFSGFSSHLYRFLVNHPDYPVHDV